MHRLCKGGDRLFEGFQFQSPREHSVSLYQNPPYIARVLGAIAEVVKGRSKDLKANAFANLSAGLRYSQP